MKKTVVLATLALLLLGLFAAARPAPAAACDCGCTLTQGYWKNHPDDWPKDQDPYGYWFDTEMTWYEVLWTNPRGGNAYYILAHQYIAAKLNALNGAWYCVPADVKEANGGAHWLLKKYQGTLEIPKGTDHRMKAIRWYEILDAYNNGYMGVPHCD